MRAFFAVVLLCSPLALAGAVQVDPPTLDVVQSLGERLAGAAMPMLDSGDQALPSPASARAAIARAASAAIVKLRAADLVGADQDIDGTTGRVEVVMALPSAQRRVRGGWLREIPRIPAGCSIFWVQVYDAQEGRFLDGGYPRRNYRAFVCGAGEQADLLPLAE